MAALKERRKGVEFYGDNNSMLRYDSPNIFNTEVAIETEFITGNIKLGTYYAVLGDRAFELNIDSGGALRLETSIYDPNNGNTAYPLRANCGLGAQPYTKYKVIARRKGDTIYFSVNGVDKTVSYLDTRRDLPFGYMNPSGGTRQVDIGRRYGAGLPFLGRIHYIKVYSDYDMKNLVHHYDFRQGTVPTVSDLTGIGTKLSLTGRVRMMQKAANRSPKKNLVKPFTDSGWVFGGTNVFTVINPYTLRGNFTDNVPVSAYIIIPVRKSGTYTISFVGDTAKTRVRIGKGSDNALIGSTNGGTKYTFTVPAGEMSIRLSLDNNGNNLWNGGICDFTAVQLEEGSNATTPENYQEINKVAKKVPKKNLIKPTSELKPYNPKGWSFHGEATKNGDYGVTVNQTGSYRTSGVDVELKPNTTYTLSCINKGGARPTAYCKYNNSSGATIYNIINLSASFVTFTTPNVPYTISARVEFHGDTYLGVSWVEGLMLVEGTDTKFDPYTELNKAAIKGKFMDGRKDYIQLPAITMDYFEIDCLLDTYQPQSGWFLFDARTSATGDNFINTGAIGSNLQKFTVDGTWHYSGSTLPKGTRKTMSVTYKTPVSNPLFLFSRFADAGNDNAKGIIYGIKCYLNNQLVYSVDYEKNKAVR